MNVLADIISPKKLRTLLLERKVLAVHFTLEASGEIFQFDTVMATLNRHNDVNRSKLAIPPR